MPPVNCCPCLPPTRAAFIHKNMISAMMKAYDQDVEIMKSEAYSRGYQDCRKASDQRLDLARGLYTMNTPGMCHHCTDI